MAQVRLVKVVALGWVLGAVALTLTLAPQLGYRGWMWLAAFDLLCALGAGWELLVRGEPPRPPPRPPSG